MNVKRFFAPTARDALRQVKEDMGGEAIVLSNRTVDGGVEILAMPPQALSGLHSAAQPPRRPQAQSAPPALAPADAEDADFKVSLSQSLHAHGAARLWRPFEARKIAPPIATPKDVIPSNVQPKAVMHQPPLVAPAEAPALPAASAVRPQPLPAAAQPIAMPEELRQELASIKALIERQLAGFAWGELARATPAKSALLGELLENGFSGELARRLVRRGGGRSRPGRRTQRTAQRAQPRLDDARFRCRHHRSRRRLCLGRAHRSGQDYDYRQTRGALRSAPRRRQAGSADHGWLPYRRPRATAHLRSHPRRQRARGTRCRRSAGKHWASSETSTWS